MEIEATSEPATKGELALARAELLAEIRNLRTWAEGRFAAMEARLAALEAHLEAHLEARLEAFRQEMLGRIEQSEKRMWRAMALQTAGLLAGVAAIQRLM